MRERERERESGGGRRNAEEERERDSLIFGYGKITLHAFIHLSYTLGPRLYLFICDTHLLSSRPFTLNHMATRLMHDQDVIRKYSL